MMFEKPILLSGDLPFHSTLHRKLVTCLSVSMDGTLLLSGSHEETIRLWDIQSKQSIRSINHKGKLERPLVSTNPCLTSVVQTHLFSSAVETLISPPMGCMR